jgi:hypothetical protein
VTTPRWIGLLSHVTDMGERSKVHEILLGKFKVNGSLGMPRRT